MAARARRLPRPRPGSGIALPIVSTLVMVVAFFLIAQIGDRSISWSNGYDVMQLFGQLGLVTLAVALTMIVGEFDLSVPAMYGLGGTIAVLTGDPNPYVGVLLAVGVGLVVGLVQGLIIAKVRMSSIPVTLGGWLILSGLMYILTKNESVGYLRFEVGGWLDAVFWQVLSWHSVIILVAFTAIGAVLAFTRLGPEVRSVGGDRRAARVAGVAVDRVLIGTFVVSAVCAAFAGALQGYSLAGTSPNMELTPLIFAVTAAVLGGISVEGGRGTALGVALGVLALGVLQEGLVIVNATDSLSDVVTGALLMVAALISAPKLAGRLRRPPDGGIAATPDVARAPG